MHNIQPIRINWLPAAALLLWAASVVFFVLGITRPILETGINVLDVITIQQRTIYLFSSFRFFWNEGDAFIAILLLAFTIIMPVAKYLFLLLAMAGRRLKRHRTILAVLDIINKWSMLDVFVVALLIMNMKFNSKYIISNLRAGATYFAVSVVLLMLCSAMVNHRLKRKP